LDFCSFQALSIMKRLSAGFQSLTGMVQRREAGLTAQYTPFSAELSSGKSLRLLSALRITPFNDSIALVV
jgi:hypothetical protein